MEVFSVPRIVSTLSNLYILVTQPVYAVSLVQYLYKKKLYTFQGDSVYCFD